MNVITQYLLAEFRIFFPCRKLWFKKNATTPLALFWESPDNSSLNMKDAFE